MRRDFQLCWRDQCPISHQHNLYGQYQPDEVSTPTSLAPAACQYYRAGAFMGFHPFPSWSAFPPGRLACLRCLCYFNRFCFPISQESLRLHSGLSLLPCPVQSRREQPVRCNHRQLWAQDTETDWWDGGNTRAKPTWVPDCASVWSLHVAEVQSRKHWRCCWESISGRSTLGAILAPSSRRV